ncbi:uncharacterized protein sytl2a isoform X2 [Cetorhinus maximus]
MLDKYTVEHMKAADESISKVLDWFTRSEEMPPVNTKIEEMKTPPEPIVENKPKAVITVNAKPDTEFSHNEADMFTKKEQMLPYINHEIQGQGEQEIQLQEVQTPIKENSFDKSLIPEPIFFEEKNKTGTKRDFEITYPLSQNIFRPSNDEQQHIKLEQVEESESGLSVLKSFPEKGRAGANENANGESKNSQAISEDTDFFLIAANKNSAQETKSGPESASLNVEESKTLTTGAKSTTERGLPTIQKHSQKLTTSSQENAFANTVFGKSTKEESIIDMKSSNYRLAKKGTKSVTIESLYSLSLDNEVVQDLDHTKTEKEQCNDKKTQLKISGKYHVTTTCEKPFSEKERQGSKNVHTPVNDTKKQFTKQNEQETNALRGKSNVNVLDLEQTLNNKEYKTEVNLHLEKNNTNAIPVKEKPFTIVSIKKRICNVSDDPYLNHTEFRNLRNFWDKGTKRHDDDAQSVLASTPDDKRLIIMKMATSTEPSNSDTPDEGSKNESMKTHGYSGPSVQERMQLILQQRKTQTEKKRLNTKYFPKVLPTEPEEIKVKLKKATNASNENELFPMSSDFQKGSAEVEEAAQDKTICQPKLKELNTLNIGLQKRLKEKGENKTSPVEKQDNYEKGLQPDHQTFMLSDNEPVDRKMANTQLSFEDINLRHSPNKPNASNNIRNNEEENIPEKRFHSQIPSVLKPTSISFQDENSSIGQSASNEVSSNEENLALFAGRSSVREENDIPQKKLNKSESLDNKIQGSLKPDEISFEEEKIPPVKTDNDSKYGEDLGIALDKDMRGFDQEDEFQSELNLPSGMTKMSNFKECDVSPTKKSTGTFKSDMPYNLDQDALPKNVLSDYSGGNYHLRAETWRSSLSEEEEMSPLVLRRNSHKNETYKSLEDINSISSMPNTLDSTNKEMILSADNVSTIPESPGNTLLQSKRMKRLSKSVPAFPEVSGSTMSIYSGDFGNIDVRGKIQFSLDYVDKLKEFHIFVVRCSDLAAAEEKKNRSDPYVKSYLLPDKIKMGKRKTSVKKKSLNPVYNEVLRYKIEKATLMAQTLNLSVWHNDTFGRNSFLGEVEVELKKWDWSNKKMDWHKLKPRTLSVNRMDDRGSLKVAFRYIPQGQGGKKAGEVQIWVKEASNLPQIRPNRLDPFVKCFILPDTSRKSRQKTRVVKKNRNPVFNHTMVYDGFRTEDLKDACVELSVWDHDKLLNHFLGGLRIGLGTGKSYGQAVDWMDSTEEEVSVWDKMITHPNTWIEDVLPLRMLMLSKMSGN